jgi:2-polyprenyl-6-methoxyphenol hydroxylase-like FAD-dependent oxidoreductase
MTLEGLTGNGHSDEAPAPHCCIVGGGPAGVMLSLVLARAGVPVTLLEAHHNFDRDFRGDTIHPSTLEVLDQLGLADRLHGLPHAKVRDLRIVSPTGIYPLAVFSRLPTRFPYVMIMPQSRFLEFLTEEAKKHPHFTLVMGARVERLIEEHGVVRGVSYRGPEGWRDVRAPLTVGTDGRFSRLRTLAALEPVSQSAPMEAMWFRLPRRPEDRHDEATINVGAGYVLILLGRDREWQGAYVVAKGGYHRLKTEGMSGMQQAIAASVPWLADRVELLHDWHQVKLLSVEANRLTRWHRPGLLLLGDAAHVMLPVGGVGINCAIADAVEAANVLSAPLRAGRVQNRHLAEVQRRREWLTRGIQRFQAVLQKRIVGQALVSPRPFRPPLPLRVILRIPGLRTLPARVMAFGIRRARLERSQERQVGSETR